MQVTVENTDTLGRRLTIQVPADQVKTAIQERMREFSQKARISGFRPGKAPKDMLEQRYGTQVRQEAVGKVIETTLPLALQENNLKPAGRPVVEQINNKTDQDLQFVVSFEVFPEVKLQDVSKIQIEKYQVEITEEEVEKTLERLRHQFAEWVVVEREAKEGDRVLVDYTSTLNGKPYENNQGSDVSVEIGSRVFIEGFEEGLIGRRAGEDCHLELTFPKEWRMEKLAGMPVRFQVKVKSVSEKHLAELNQAFAKKVNAPSEDKSAICQKIRENMEKQAAEMVENRMKEQATEALLTLNPIAVPKALIEREASLLHEELHQRTQGQGGQDKHTGCHHPGLEEKAEKRVALGLILNEIIKSENLTPDETRVKQRIASLSKMFGNAEFIESMYYESEELLSNVRHTILLDQALEWVLTQAQTVEKPLTLEALFNRQAT